MSALRDSYCTPRLVTQRLPLVDIDPCSNPRSTVLAKLHIMLPECTRDVESKNWDWIDRTVLFQSGLEYNVSGKVVFYNPPFSDPEPWAYQSIDAKEFGFLCNIDPTTQWWRYATLRKGWQFTFADRLEYDPPPGVVRSKNDRPSCILATNGFREMCEGRFDNLGQWWKRT